MPEPTPSGLAEGTDRCHDTALSPEAVESVLADFRAWLQQAPAEPAEPLDLAAILSHFVALRHEVNLQTKAARAQQEQNTETLEQLGQALDLLERQAEAAREQETADTDEALRPLLKTLVDVYDALSIARREVQRVQESVLPQLGQLTAVIDPGEEPPVATEQRATFWQRWFGSPPAGDSAVREALAAQRQRFLALQEAKRNQAEQAADRLRQVFESVVAGYTMSLQRVERALAQHGLEPIPAVGQSFDPEQMEVLDAVTGSGRPSGEVLEEVRRGYLWRGRIFRYAQVRVARG